MYRKHLLITPVLIISILILAGTYFVFADSPEKVIFTINSHIFLGPLLLILWRIIGIIFPIIPAGVISFAAVPIFGWLATYIYTVTGIMIGTSISFFLARKFREPLAGRFAPAASRSISTSLRRLGRPVILSNTICSSPPDW